MNQRHQPSAACEQWGPLGEVQEGLVIEPLISGNASRCLEVLSKLRGVSQLDDGCLPRFDRFRVGGFSEPLRQRFAAQLGVANIDALEERAGANEVNIPCVGVIRGKKIAPMAREISPRTGEPHQVPSVDFPPYLGVVLTGDQTRVNDDEYQEDGEEGGADAQ